MTFSTVLVPLDGSDAAESILPFLLEIADPLDMTLILLVVVEPPAPPAPGEAAHLMVEQDVTRARREAEDYLAALTETLREAGVDARCEVRRGAPAHEILAAARERRADLIAMTTHARSGFGRLLFGSVAEAVLRGADVPIFLMRQAAAHLAPAKELTA